MEELNNQSPPPPPPPSPQQPHSPQPPPPASMAAIDLVDVDTRYVQSIAVGLKLRHSRCVSSGTRRFRPYWFGDMRRVQLRKRARTRSECVVDEDDVVGAEGAPIPLPACAATMTLGAGDGGGLVVKSLSLENLAMLETAATSSSAPHQQQQPVPPPPPTLAIDLKVGELLFGVGTQPPQGEAVASVSDRIGKLSVAD